MSIKNTKSALAVGSYIVIGNYAGQSIKWQVVDLQDDKAVLHAQNILTYKCFDAMHDAGQEADQDRIHYGSNRWSSSNLRTWLNSDSQQVSYSGTAPSEAGVWQGKNAYDKEPGFLHGFTSQEKALLVPVTHEATLPGSDKLIAAGGREHHVFEDAYPDIALRNYDLAYYETVTDRVFLLSIKEVCQFVLQRGFDWIRRPTPQAAERDETGGHFPWYWLRTAVGADTHGVRVVCVDGYVAGRSAYRGSIGVVPAICINAEQVSVSGAGSEEHPYTLI